MCLNEWPEKDALTGDRRVQVRRSRGRQPRATPHLLPSAFTMGAQSIVSLIKFAKHILDVVVTPALPTLRRLRQEDGCLFEASSGYTAAPACQKDKCC